MKGLLLAGGSSTHLYPLTPAVSEHLLPVYDKPVVYYPLSLLMLAGVRDVMVVGPAAELPRLRDTLGDGSPLGLTISYRAQERPGGLAAALSGAADWLDGSPVVLVRGDNLLYGHHLPELLRRAATTRHGAQVFAYHVMDPERYAVVEFDRTFRALSIEERPERPRSNHAVTGLYFYDGRAAEIAARARDITDVNRAYLDAGELTVTPLGRGVAWMDMGSPEALLSASLFVRTLEERTGLKIACLEEIALAQGFIDVPRFERRVAAAGKSEYGRYLRRVLLEHRAAPRSAAA